MEAAARLPNVPDETVPDGASDEDNVELRRWGAQPAFDVEPLDHVELGERLAMIDIERGVKTSGSRFYYLTGAAVRLQFALVRYGLDFADARGRPPWVRPPWFGARASSGRGSFPTTRTKPKLTRTADPFGSAPGRV